MTCFFPYAQNCAVRIGNMFLWVAVSVAATAAMKNITSAPLPWVLPDAAARTWHVDNLFGG